MTGVGYLDDRVVAGCCGLQLYPPLCGDRLEGVGQQVDHDLAQAVRVGPGGQSLGTGHDNSGLLFFSQAAKAGGNPLQEQVEAYGLALQVQKAGLSSGQFIHTVQDGGQTAGFLVK